jgi:hypothetical protein
MAHKRLKISALFLILGGLTILKAQESTPASGGDITGTGGSVSFSVGQVFYGNFDGSSGSVTEGVQQPYEISVVTGLEEARNINLSVSAYPNPTTDYLELKVESEKLKDFSYQLYDMNGKLLQNKKLTGTETQIDMRNLVPATYFVKVIVKTQGIASQEVKTFKIIKTQ